MKNSLKLLMVATSVLLSTTNYAQIKNAKTETVKVYGNCGMCETKIENAGSLKRVSEVDWNKDTQMASITYDANKTNKDEILKKIALAGYDSNSFLAPNDAYNKLPGCCQYERVGKTPVKEEMKMEASHANHNMDEKMAEGTAPNMNESKEEMKMETSHANHDMKEKMAESKTTTMNQPKEKMKMDASHSNHAMNEKMAESKMQKMNQLDALYTNYFGIKDALVKTDGNAASANAKGLLASINAVKMGELEMDVHMVWMKVVADLKVDAKKIADTKDAKSQRGNFDTLSENIYKLIKVSKSETTVYFQHCPMANNGKGANWLSKENNIKNPYYGSMMLGCGKTVETIK